MKKQYFVHLALLIVNLIYAGNYSIAKIALPKFILPFGFILLRVAGASVVFFLIHQLFVKERVKKADVPRLILCGIFGVAVNQLLFFKGLSITQPINAALMMITTPILVLLVSSIALKERITLLKSLGILFGGLGAILVISKGEFSFNTQTALGDFFILLNAASYAMYLVLVKPLMSKYNPLTIIMWVFLIGLLPVTFFGWEEMTQIQFETFNTPVWLSLIYVILFTTCIAYLLNIFALSSVNPSVVGAYIYLQPILATIIAILMGKDHLSFINVIAAVLIFSGVFLISFKRNKVIT